MSSKKIKTINFIIIAAVTLIVSFALLYFLTADKHGYRKMRKSFARTFYVSHLRETAIPEQKFNIEEYLGNKGKFKSYIVSFVCEGLKQYALMNIPVGHNPERGYPVVVVNHGYIPPAEYSTADSYKLISSYFASEGFIVIKPDYRGHGKSEGEDDRTFARLRYAVDVKYAVSMIQGIENADKDNIFLFGHSMGGDITLKVLASDSGIRAASIWAPAVKKFPENFVFFARKRDKLAARSIEQILRSVFDQEDMKRISSVENLEYINAPVIIRHGTDDDSVPYQWGADIYANMKALGKDVVLVTYEGEDHNLARRSFYKALKDDADFFRSKMK